MEPSLIIADAAQPSCLRPAGPLWKMDSKRDVKTARIAPGQRVSPNEREVARLCVPAPDPQVLKSQAAQPVAIEQILGINDQGAAQ